jgi:hypothetical protein
MTLVAVVAAMTAIALVAVPMIAVAAATIATAGARRDAVFQAFHFENSSVHLIPPRCEDRKYRELAPIKLPARYGECNAVGTTRAKDGQKRMATHALADKCGNFAVIWNVPRNRRAISRPLDRDSP